MSNKSRDPRNRARLLLDAYIESLVGIFALRLPTVRDAVILQAPKITVESSYNGEHVNLHADVVVQEVQTSGPAISATVDQITSAFVAAMWDTLLSHAHYDSIATNPEIQFFRHLRNACGHNGRWNFSDLRHPAIWRDKKLRMEHVGEQVFGKLLKHGDVVLLFTDIDRKYFEQ